MYTFRDTIEASEEIVLPSEALKINGEYIENQISGYRTLHVAGREALSPDVVSYGTGIRDGSRIKSKRYPERILVVTYQIIAKTNEEFREAYNKLGKILNVKEAELIFRDEEDKFFIGTPCIMGEVTPGKNAVVGNFEILCADPFKYSVIEYEAKPSLDAGSVLIDYNGTYKCYPKLEADFFSEDDGSTDGALTGNGDCGYVAFYTEDEKIIQLGDPDEVDGSNAFAKSQTLVNQTFLSDTAWGTTAKRLWAVNASPAAPTAVTQLGSVAMAAASYASTTAASTSGTLLTARSTAEMPYVDYKVTAKTSGRTANSVKVDIAVTASLYSAGSYLKGAQIIVASVYIGGAWHDVTVHNAYDNWKGKTGHTANLSVTVTGLSASTTALTGIKFKAYRKDSLGSTGVLGETACSNLPVSAYVESTAESWYLTPSSYGSASGVWHGPTITRTIGADASGEVGAANFTLTYKQKMSIGNTSGATGQLGAFQALLVDANKKIVAGVRISKNTAGKFGHIALLVNGKVMTTTEVSLAYNNTLLGSNTAAARTSTIQKSGKTVSFNISGWCRSYTDNAIESLKATHIVFVFEQCSAQAALSYNGLFSAKFVKNNCETWKEIPNKFSADDVVVADCKTAEVYLNGLLKPELGALGNDWEDFVLTPGLNQIGISYSDWVQSGCAPTMKVRYREVFL